MSGFTLVPLPETARAQAAQLYWAAFGPKLGRLFGPDARALDYLGRTIRCDHAFAALDARGSLLGVAGFKSPTGAFADGGWPEMRAVYGATGAGWRIGVLRLMHNEVDNINFLVDGISVAREARGQGIGSALVMALCDEGRRRGYGTIRLDVIAENIRARALYERLGFEVTATQRLGALRHLTGVTTVTTMVRRLG